MRTPDGRWIEAGAVGGAALVLIRPERDAACRSRPVRFPYREPLGRGLRGRGLEREPPDEILSGVSDESRDARRRIDSENFVVVPGRSEQGPVARSEGQ